MGGSLGCERGSKAACPCPSKAFVGGFVQLFGKGLGKVEEIVGERL